MIRYYIMPIVTVGSRRQPKYTVPSGYTMIDYGMQPTAVVRMDVTVAEHDAIAINSDVWAPPQVLDTGMTNQNANAVTTFLEARNIPGNGWIGAGLSFRACLRTVAAMFQFSQRWNGLGGGLLFSVGKTLSTTYGELSTEDRLRLDQLMDSFGYDDSFIVANTTLRVILKTFADIWGATPIFMGGEEL
jgi:hypothetical protein